MRDMSGSLPVIAATVFVSACLALTTPVSAQLNVSVRALDPTNFPTIRLQTYVTDDGYGVSGLNRESFVLFENGVPRDLEYGYCQDTISGEPLSIMLVIERTRYIPPFWPHISELTKNFAGMLRPGDEMAVCSYAEDFTYNQPWTEDSKQIQSAIDSITFFDHSRWLRSALGKACGYFNDRTKRRVMIVFGLRDDLYSPVSYNTLLAMAQSLGITVYLIGNEHDTKQLADATGGMSFSGASPNDMTEEEVRHAYATIWADLLPRGVCEFFYETENDHCMDGRQVEVTLGVQFDGRVKGKSATYTVPYDPSTITFANIRVAPSQVVEAGSTIEVPVILQGINQGISPMSTFEFDIGFDASMLELQKVLPGSEAFDYSVQYSHTAEGAHIILSGERFIEQTGELARLMFHVVPRLSSASTPLDLGSPRIFQPCSDTYSDSGIVYINGTCQPLAFRPTEPPPKTCILGNSPNPFAGGTGTPVTTVRYSVRSDGPATLRVYDAAGRAIATLADNYMSAGIHSAVFDAGNLPGGVYYIHLVSGGEHATRQMLLAK